jgi:hypothetical protein
MKSDISFGTQAGYEFLDLRSKVLDTKFKNDWFRVNPLDVYRSTEEWYVHNVSTVYILSSP